MTKKNTQYEFCWKLPTADEKLRYQFCSHSAKGNLTGIKNLYENHPNFNVNYRHSWEWTTWYLPSWSEMWLPDELLAGGYSPLMAAAAKGQLEVCLYLIQECGADINFAGGILNDCTPLICAERWGGNSILTVYLRKESNNRRRHNPIRQNMPTRFLSEEQSEYKLHELAGLGRAQEITNILLTHGGSLERLNNTGDTPLLVAVRNGFLDVVDVLLRHGARLECRTTPQDETPISLALAQGHAELVNYFEQQQAVFARDSEGNTSLHKAVSAGKLDKVEELLQRGAYVNAQNVQGQTPLHLAAKKAYRGQAKDIATRLIAAKADMSLVDEHGKTALFQLNRSSPRDFTGLLIEQRNRLPSSRIYALLENCACHYVGDFESREADKILLDQAFQSLTGSIHGANIKALMDTYLLVYLGSLISLKGDYERVSYSQNDSFEGFWEFLFLPLRGRILLETLVRIQKNQLTNYPGSKETVETSLIQELICLLEALRSLLDRRFIYFELQDASWALEAHARNLCKHIAALEVGQHYQYCAGYNGHALYANFENRADTEGRIIYRLDNLGEGIRNRHRCKRTPFKRKEGEGRKCLPYAISLPASDFAPASTDPALVVTQMLAGNFKSSEIALALLYDTNNTLVNKIVIPREQLESWYPWRRIQNVGNCVVKNNQIGWQIRLQNYSPTHALYHWWREQEVSLIPIKSYLAQAAVATGYGVPRLAQLEAPDTAAQAFYLDAAIAEKIVQEAKDQGYTELHLAIVAGNLNKVESLVEGGASLTTTTSAGYHALHLAAIYQTNDILDYLLEQASRKKILNRLLDAATVHGDTIFQLLARQPAGKSSETLILLQKYKSTNNNDRQSQDSLSNIPAEEEQTIAHWPEALRSGSLDIIAKTLAKAPANDTDAKGNTPIHLAVLFNRKDAFTIIMQHGVEINHINHRGETSLHWAVQMRNMKDEVIQWLVEQGIEIDALTQKNERAIDIALNLGKDKVVNYLLQAAALVNGAIFIDFLLRNTSVARGLEPSLQSRGAICSLSDLSHALSTASNRADFNRLARYFCGRLKPIVELQKDPFYAEIQQIIEDNFNPQKVIHQLQLENAELKKRLQELEEQLLKQVPQQQVAPRTQLTLFSQRALSDINTGAAEPTSTTTTQSRDSVSALIAKFEPKVQTYSRR